MVEFCNFASAWLIAQAEPVAVEGPGGPVGPAGFLNSPLFPLLMIGVLFYFMLILPDRKKKKQLELTLANLKKNDPVITVGGICGTVVNAPSGSKVITIRVDDNARIKILRSHISHVGAYDDVEEKKDGA